MFSFIQAVVRDGTIEAWWGEAPEEPDYTRPSDVLACV